MFGVVLPHWLTILVRQADWKTVRFLGSGRVLGYGILQDGIEPLEHVRDDGEGAVFEGAVHLRVAQTDQNQGDEAARTPIGTSARPVMCGRLVTFIPTTPATAATRPRRSASPDVRVNRAAIAAASPLTKAVTAAADVQEVRTSATGGGPKSASTPATCSDRSCVVMK